MSGDETVFVLLITDGRDVEYAPELYLDRLLAMEEAVRWAWFLGEYGSWPVKSTARERWQVGIHEILLMSAHCPAGAVEYWCAVDLEGAPTLAGGERIHESRTKAEQAIRDGVKASGPTWSTTDIRLEPSHLSIHRLKAVLSNRNSSTLSLREP
jgi:hypothetical protein